MSIDIKKMQLDDKQTQKEGFEHFKSMETTRLMISLLPPMEDKADVLETLLKSCYSAGFSVGGTHTAIQMLNMVKPRKS